MIVFKYTKKDGAEYLSHLDMLRHLNRIIKRTGVETSYSKGFNPHMNIYMSAPIAVGVISHAEFCLVESEIDADEFKRLFNKFSFKGVECSFSTSVSKKVSVAGVVNRASYVIKGVNKFDVDKVLSAERFEFTNKKGERKEVRNKIFDLQWKDDFLIAVLGFGNEGLRPDLFANELISLYGGQDFVEVVKTNCFVNEKTFEEYLLSLS